MTYDFSKLFIANKTMADVINENNVDGKVCVVNIHDRFNDISLRFYRYEIELIPEDLLSRLVTSFEAQLTKNQIDLNIII